jgi:hypothetical protein
VAQSVEGGDSRAKERAGFRGVEALRHCGERFQGSDHVFLVVAIEADSANFQVAAIGEISVPADADTLAVFPAGDARKSSITPATSCRGGAEILNAGLVSFFYRYDRCRKPAQECARAPQLG